MSIVYKVKFDSEATELISSVLKTEPCEKNQSSEMEFDPKILAQRMAVTITRVEQENEVNISQMRNGAISKIMSLMAQAERSNELILTNMISALPNYDSKIFAESLSDLDELSEEITLNI